MKINKTKTIKVWAVVDTSVKPHRVFNGHKGDFHIFTTKKTADYWIDEQFFPARKMKWKAKKFNLSPTSNK